MKISIDTKEDSHEEIRKVIKMLQNLVGGQEVFTNQPSQETTSPFANIFGDTFQATPTSSEVQNKNAQTQETSESTEDLLAELFSEEELKKMDTATIKNEDEEIKPKEKKYNIELY